MSGTGPRATNPSWFVYGLLLGAAGGAAIGLGLLVALCWAGSGEWSILPAAALLGAPAGALAGAAEALLALAGVALIGRTARTPVWPAAIVAGLIAAVLPLVITFHAGWPRADGGIWIGLGLAGSAFLAGISLTPIALRAGRGRAGRGSIAARNERGAD